MFLEHSGKQMILPITNQLKDTILESLHPLAEQWAGVKLLGTSVYGIRTGLESYQTWKYV